MQYNIWNVVAVGFLSGAVAASVAVILAQTLGLGLTGVALPIVVGGVSGVLVSLGRWSRLSPLAT